MTTSNATKLARLIEQVRRPFDQRHGLPYDLKAARRLATAYEKATARADLAEAKLAHLAAQPVTGEAEREYRGTCRTGEPDAGHICDTDCHEDQHGIEWHSYDPAEPVTVEWGVRFGDKTFMTCIDESWARQLADKDGLTVVRRTVTDWKEVTDV